MKKKVTAILIGMLTSAVLVSCGPTRAELDAQATQIAADISAIQTREASTPTPSLTPTVTPTSTPTFTPTLTLTPSPRPTYPPTFTPVPTPVLPPLPAGWQRHATYGFRIALPVRWIVVAVHEQGIDAIWSLLEGIETEWAQAMTEMLSSEAMWQMLKFWAMDPEPAGMGNATVNITYQFQPIPMSLEDICAQMPSIYEQVGIEVLDVDCDMEINELEAARFTIRLPMGFMAIKEYQYAYVQGSNLWILTLGVGETEWSEYEPIFVTIAESFLVD